LIGCVILLFSDKQGIVCSLESSRAPSKAMIAADDLAWAERCAYWQPEPTKPPARRSRNPARSALILSGHGIRLRVDHGALVIRDGFTHYPQTVSEHRLFPGSVDLPSRIVGHRRKRWPVLRRDDLAVRATNSADPDRLEGQCSVGDRRGPFHQSAAGRRPD
jgi:hypothetical protein